MSTANFVVFDLNVGDRTLNAAAISAILELNPSGLSPAALASALASPPAIGGTAPGNVFAANLSSTGSVTEGAQTLAAAGSSQATAGIVAASASVVFVTVTASTQGIRMPASATGRKITVLGAPTVGAKVYPATNARLGGAATNAAITIASNKGAVFYGLNATTWRYVKGA